MQKYNKTLFLKIVKLLNKQLCH